MSKFYAYQQNNSGGSFDYDEKKGISLVVFIEANSAEQANALAGMCGIYFDGVDKGRDCECCGDRWYEASESDGSKEPSVYETPAKESTGLKSCWVHYLDGTKKTIGEIYAD